MPAYKDCSTGTWYVKINYQDWDGNNKQKFKRGFKTKRDAVEFERNFKLKNEGVTSMKFSDFVELYLKDMSVRWKPTTTANKKSKIKTWITPYFGDKPLNEITVMDVRKWQNKQKTSGLAGTTQRKNHVILSGIFNYAVKYYNLPENPCRKAGTIGTTKRESFEFWTLEEFNDFIEHVPEWDFQVAFKTLYFTGLRIGELMALTPADFDFSIPKLTVNKNYQVVDGVEYLLEPKTENSKRDVLLPTKLANEIEEYINSIYGITNDQRIFLHHKSSYGNKLRKICVEFGLKKIRIHDLRHSHASLLIELGYSPVLIAERLGHDDIKTTLNTYSHLYPSKQKELADDLDNLI